MRPVTDLQRKVAPFEVISDMVPAGDQPQAIAEISRRVEAGDGHTVLLGDLSEARVLREQLPADAAPAKRR